MANDLHAAVAQCPADLDTPQDRLCWLASVLSEHHAEPLDLVVLPELFQCGYNIGDRVNARAETRDGPFAQKIATLARMHNTAIVYGYAEHAEGKLYNSALCINTFGELAGHHRKLLLPPGFEGDHFAPDDGCRLFSLGAFTIAIVICYDVEFPETLRHVVQAGADLVVVPTALGAEWGIVADCVIPTRAFENGVFLCYANYCRNEGDLEYFGGSCIVAPNGATLARAGTDASLLRARLEQSAVALARDRLPYFTDRHKLPWSKKGQF
ncbi:carbon-nitrogen hydrolase family protein [Meridianimarinicoccus aquatilis]|uniref:Carbon-nitrogen hydrolase family protein n=1 Tax=Meridianimarinicoccus aquatilis TaxID=2552766 RepID=A0A4R6AQY5_9RHOB|nr:carbon-nitrogen hydrolase family protein [Fluviibacterium aquatile]TDL86901.1 carbon-nitrogen hydrolase family protein [Fluviibacterium aquatile]